MYFYKSLTKITSTLLVLLTMTLPASSVFGANIQWADSVDGNWSDGTKWSTGTVPGSGDIAYINLDGTYTITMDQNVTLTALVLGAATGTQTLTGSSYDLTVNGTISNGENGVLDLISGDLLTSSGHVLMNDGTVRLTNGAIQHNINNFRTVELQRTCSFTGEFLNDTTGTMTLTGTSSGTCYLTVDSGFVNRGTIELTSDWPPTTTTSQITVTDGSLENEPTGNINALLGASFNTASIRYINAEMINQGTITGLSTAIRMWHDDADHSNTGTLYGQGGGVTVSGATNPSTFTNTGTITVDEGASFGCGTEICTFSSGTVANNGTISMQCDTIYITPKWTNNGRMTLGMSYLSLTDTLFNDGTVTLTGGSIHNSVFVNNDSLLFANGSVYSDLVNDGVVKAQISGNVRSGFTSGVGSKVIAEGTTLNACQINFYSTMTNHGTIELTQEAQNGATFNLITTTDTLINASDGTIDILAGAGGTTGSRSIGARLHNHGTLNAEAGSPTLVESGVVHINSGTINVNAGNLLVQNELTNSGTINIAASAMYEQSGGPLKLSGGTCAGDGIMSLVSDSVYVTGSCTNDATMNLTSANVVNSGTLTNTDSLVLNNADITGAGTIVNESRMTSYLSDVGCDLTNDGMLTVTRINNFTGSFSNGLNDTVIVLGNANGSAEMNVASTFTNSGHISLTSDQANGTTTATLSVGSGTLSNASTGTILADGGSSTGGERYLYAEISNQGTIANNNIKLVLEKASADHSNFGTISLDAAAMDFNLTGTTGSFTNAGTIDFDNLMTLTVDQGDFINGMTGIISGNGSLNTYATTFTNNGYVNPGSSPGKLNFQANTFPMSSINAQINIEIGGLTAVTEHDQVYCTQTAGLGGVLNLTLIDDFYPSVGDSFKVLTYTTRSGNFDAVLGLSQNGYTFDTNFVSDGLWIVTDALDNTAPVITGMPATYSFNADSTGLLGIWNYVSDDHTSDSNHTYVFTVSNDSLNYNLNAAGFLELTADAGFAGDVTLGMTVTDEHGASSSDTTVVTVLAANAAPVVSMPDTLTFRTDVTFGYGMWAVVADAESHDTLLTYAFTTSNDSLVTTFYDATGTLALSTTNDFVGTAMLYASVTDPDGGEGVDTVTVVVTAVPNTPPVISGLADTVTFRTDSTVSITVWDFVADAETHDTLLTYDATSSNDSVVTGFTPATGVFTISATDDFTGTAMVIVTVTDPEAASDVDTIIAVVTAIPNTPPVISGLADTVTFRTDSLVSITVWDFVADAETHDTLLTYDATSSNDSVVTGFTPATGVFTISATDDFTGTAMVIVTVTDPEAASDVDTIIAVVTAIPNTPPVISGLADTVTFRTDSTVSITVWDFVADAETHDTLLTYDATSSNDSVVTEYEDSTGVWTIYATDEFSGTAMLIVTVTDPEAASDVDTVIAVVTPIPNTPPVISGLADTATFRTDSTWSITAWDYVADAETHDSLLTYDATSSNDSVVTDFTPATGVFTLSATDGFSGTAMVIVTVTDPQAASDVDTIIAVVTPMPNTAPVVDLVDTVTFNYGGVRYVDLWGGTTDTQTHDTLLIYDITDNQDSLLATYVDSTGELRLEATDDWNGNASVYVSVEDPEGLMGYDTVQVVVTALPNTAPVVTLPDTVIFRTDSTHVMTLWDYVVDDESADNALTYSFSRDSLELGCSYFSVTGELTIFSDSVWSGESYLHVTATDPGSLQGIDSILVIVQPLPNTAPVFSLPDTITFRADSAVTLVVWDYIADAESPDSLLILDGSESNDSLLVEFEPSTGVLTFTAEVGYHGTAYMYASAQDPEGLFGYDTVTVVVTRAPKTPPEVNLPDSLTFDADTSITLDVWSLVTDSYNDTLLYYAFSTSNDSLLQSYESSTGIVTISAEAGWSGLAVLRLVVTDPDTAIGRDSVFVTVTPAMSVGEDDDLLPQSFALHQNYPNPFNPATLIEYSVPRSSHIVVAVYNVLGQEIDRLVDDERPAGRHSVFWEGTDSNGRQVASGIYFYRMQAGEFVVTKKMVLLK